VPREISQRLASPTFSFDAFEAGFRLLLKTGEEFEARLRSNALESEAKVSGCSQAMMASGNYSGYSQRVLKQLTSVHLAAYFGLGEVVGVLLKSRYDLDSKDSNGQTPLSWAASNGHEVVVKLLLDKGAELESKDKSYGSAGSSRALR
jgi:hypothetical protein